MRQFLFASVLKDQYSGLRCRECRAGSCGSVYEVLFTELRWASRTGFFEQFSLLGLTKLKVDLYCTLGFSGLRVW